MNKSLKAPILLIFTSMAIASCRPGSAGGGSVGQDLTEPLHVVTSAGTVPVLPWQILVDGPEGPQWRQVRWDGSGVDEERSLADPSLHPAGSTYSISGTILGDGTQVRAEVEVTASAKPVPQAKPVARPLPLRDVSLTGDNRLTDNREHDIEAILSWDIKQQLYNYRDTYGLGTEGYPESDGWDSPDTKLKGHGSGHYMSALAFAYASENDTARREALLERARTMVDALRECQERTFVWSDSLGRYWEARDLAPEDELRELKGDWEAFDGYKKDWTRYGYGYLNAIPAQHAVLVEMYRPYNNEKWVWAPYYSIHKQLAGLIDIALNVDDRQVADKALLIARDMGLWVWNRLHYRTFVQSEGSVEERRARPGNRYEMWNMYIAGEVGGMEESLSRLSGMVDDPEDSARLLEAARFFDSPAFFEPLGRGVDDIRTRHANQHIPMITGALKSFGIDGDPYYYNIACNFWNLLQGRYIYSTGGVGNSEMFRQPYTQTESMNSNPDPEINETCCSYNLAKLTRDLNCYDPDDARYMDYYERVLSNHLVGSIHPDHFGVTYHYAVGMDAVKHFDSETPQSSCCGGTGSENHVKYQEAAYFVSDDTMWVSLYMPSKALWREKGISLEQDCEWPAQKSVIRIREGKGRFTLKLRVPYWAVEGFGVRVNGRPVNVRPVPGSYLSIRRLWKASDEIEVDMPFRPHIYYSPDRMPGDDRWIGAVMYGPLVMSTGDVHDWDEAALDLHRDLREIVPSDAEGTVSLRIGDLVFMPDYWQTDHETHYMRIGFVD